MPKLGKRLVDRVQPGSTDYFLWDSEIPGFGLRVYPSGRLTYVIQIRSKGRTQRFTIGTHGIFTPETARREARAQLGRVAYGKNPSAEKLFDLRGCCQTNANQSLQGQRRCPLCRAKLAPLGESGGAVLFEYGS